MVTFRNGSFVVRNYERDGKKYQWVEEWKDGVLISEYEQEVLR